MTSITDLWRGPIILVIMLILAAVTRERPPEPDGYALLAQAHATMGHLGLTVIAVVFVLVNFCKG